MTASSKNLGLVKSIFSQSTSPSNIEVLWYDTIVGYHKYYNTTTGLWTGLAAVPGVDFSKFDSWRTSVRSVIYNNPSAIPSLVNGQRFLIAPAAVGDWSGKSKQIATRTGSTWTFEIPIDGWTILSTEQQGHLYVYRELTDIWNDYNLNNQGDIKSDGTVAFAASQSMGGNQLKDVANPTEPGDAINLDYFNNNSGTGVGTIQQLEVVNPSIVSSGGIEVWEFDNTLFDKYAQCALYEESTDLRLISVSNKVTDTKITFTFFTGIDIDTGTYRACVQGVQKTAPPIEEGFTYTFPFTLS